MALSVVNFDPDQQQQQQMGPCLVITKLLEFYPLPEVPHIIFIFLYILLIYRQIPDICTYTYRNHILFGSVADHKLALNANWKPCQETQPQTPFGIVSISKKEAEIHCKCHSVTLLFAASFSLFSVFLFHISFSVILMRKSLKLKLQWQWESLAFKILLCQVQARLSSAGNKVILYQLPVVKGYYNFLPIENVCNWQKDI